MPCSYYSVCFFIYQIFANTSINTTYVLKRLRYSCQTSHLRVHVISEVNFHTNKSRYLRQTLTTIQRINHNKFKRIHGFLIIRNCHLLISIYCFYFYNKTQEINRLALRSPNNNFRYINYDKIHELRQIQTIFKVSQELETNRSIRLTID